MIRRISENLLLRPENLAPLRDDFKVIGVVNPGAIKVNNEIVLLVRIAEKPLERRLGFVGLPRLGPNGNIVVDWASEEELDRADPRVVRRKADNLLRLTSILHPRVFRGSDDCSMDWSPGPTFLPTSSFPRHWSNEAKRCTCIMGPPTHLLEWSNSHERSC